MAYTVSKLDVWTGQVEDRAGGLAAKLGPLATAGADLEFVIARRRAEAPGKGVLFLSGVRGAKASKAAEAAGLTRTANLAALRVEETNKPGSCHHITQMLADAAINLRGLSASVAGKKCVYFLSFDNAADADRAEKLFRSGGKRK